MISVGELIVRALEAQRVSCAFGVISIHNMPILDAFHRREKIRFVSARGEAGACNMADAHARVTGGLGVVVTSTGTGAGNAAGALIEALTAGTPLLHLTGQIDSAYLDKNLGFIHEAPAQLEMLKSVSKAAFRISTPEQALATLQQAIQLAISAPCGPVSVEIAIDVQQALIEAPGNVAAVAPKAYPAINTEQIDALARTLSQAKRPLLWVGGGARAAQQQVQRFVDRGWCIVTSVQGRGLVSEDHSQSLAAFNLQKPVEDFYATCDVALVVGSRLRSNETLSYKLNLPQPLHRIDIDPAANQRAYSNQQFIQGDAAQCLEALADALDRLPNPIDTAIFHKDIRSARQAAETVVDQGLGPYVKLKDSLNRLASRHFPKQCVWVRDITLSNTMWGNRSFYLHNPRSGVHALGGGIGQGLAMAIGASLGSSTNKTIALVGDGGFMLNPGELACAVQEKVNVTLILMNDGGYGVIKNIQDAVYGARHCYVDLHTPNFSALCGSMGVPHFLLKQPTQCADILEQALLVQGPCIVEVDMLSWGPFVAKFAGPPKKTA